VPEPALVFKIADCAMSGDDDGACEVAIFAGHKARERRCAMPTGSTGIFEEGRARAVPLKEARRSGARLGDTRKIVPVRLARREP